MDSHKPEKSSANNFQELNSELKALYRRQLTKKLLQMYDEFKEKNSELAGTESDAFASLAFTAGYFAGINKEVESEAEYLEQLKRRD